jgi:hypothetical protein
MRSNTSTAIYFKHLFIAHLAAVVQIAPIEKRLSDVKNCMKKECRE